MDELSAKRCAMDNESSLKLSLPESANDICDLLHFIYPVAKPETQRTLQDVMRLMTIAVKYQIGVAIWHLTQELLSDHHLHSKAIRIYGFACRIGLEDVRKKGLTRAIRNDVLRHRVAEDLQNMTALELLTLVDSRKKLVDLATNLVSSWSLSNPTHNCPHPSQYGSNTSNGAQNLKLYLQLYMAVTPFSDVVTSTQTVSRFAALPLRGNGFCDLCFKDVSSVHYQQTQLSSLISGLDALLETL